jgi:Uma2 family endonuclease
MSAPAEVKLMTAEDLLLLPDDGVERWLNQGQLREKPLTYRNRWHSQIEATIVYLLKVWLEKQSRPRGTILCGEAGCRLRRNPDSVVGVDVMYVSAEVAAQQPDNTTIIEGIPVLVVEILSPSDKQEEIDEKVDLYRAAGVPLIWVVDPHDATVLVYRPQAEPMLFNRTQELSGDPQLPGLRITVADIFTR